MEILFQEFLEHPGMEDSVKSDSTLSLIYGNIYDFVHKRLWPLKDEINKEESIFVGQDNFPCIVISLIDYEKNGIIRFRGYSDSLAIKIKSCFSQSDLDFMNESIENKRRAMDN